MQIRGARDTVTPGLRQGMAGRASWYAGLTRPISGKLLHDSHRLVGEVDAYLAQPPRAVGRQALVELQPVLDGDIEEVADAELPAIRRLEDASARGVGLHLPDHVRV